MESENDNRKKNHHVDIVSTVLLLAFVSAAAITNYFFQYVSWWSLLINLAIVLFGLLIYTIVHCRIARIKEDNYSEINKLSATAAKLKDAGYKITATANDTYRVFSDNVKTPWVVDGKIQIDDNLKAWVDMSKEQVDAGYTGTGDLWGDDWSAGFYPDGKVFCYFGPAWLIDFCMAADDDASIAHAGGWGATTGPQGFSWGGTWICAANGTDNPALVADIIRKLTTDEEIMTGIVKDDNDFVNNKPAMEAMAADTSYGDDVLGGQNALAMFCEGADKIDKSNICEYDQGCTESFQAAMMDYFEGNTETYEDALDAFYQSVTEKYPELSY